MINIKISKNLGENVYAFSCSGHAGFAKKGSDIVCAAVSILVMNTVNSIKKFTNEQLNVNVDDKLGIISFWVSLPKDEEHQNSIDLDAQLLINSMISGLYDIKEEYEDYLNIVEEVQTC